MIGIIATSFLLMEDDEVLTHFCSSGTSTAGSSGFATLDLDAVEDLTRGLAGTLDFLVFLVPSHSLSASSLQSLV